MIFLHRGFRKLSYYRHTYRQTKKYIHYWNYVPCHFAGGQ